MECPLLRPLPSWRQRSGGLTVSREYHQAVMADRVAHWLGSLGGTIVDATFGGGGHSRVLLEADPQLRIIAVPSIGTRTQVPSAHRLDRGWSCATPTSAPWTTS